MPAPAPAASPDASGAAPDAPVSLAGTNAVDAGFWFPIGEEIRYRIYWGFVPVAYSTAKAEWVEHEGRQMLAIRFRTQSNNVISKIYPVDDFLETIVDPETFLPVRFTKQLKEGGYRCDEVTVFDHEAGRATWTSRLKDKTKEYDIESDTRDLISFMYSMRTTEFPIGEEQEFRVMADEKLYDLQVTALEKEEIKLPNHGKVESVRLKPTATFEGLFVRSGEMELWVSDDDRRIITMAEISVPLASVRLVLDAVGGPGEDRWTDPPEEEADTRERRPQRRRRR